MSSVQRLPLGILSFLDLTEAVKTCSAVSRLEQPALIATWRPTSVCLSDESLTLISENKLARRLAETAIPHAKVVTVESLRAPMHSQSLRFIATQARNATELSVTASINDQDSHRIFSVVDTNVFPLGLESLRLNLSGPDVAAAALQLKQRPVLRCLALSGAAWDAYTSVTDSMFVKWLQSVEQTELVAPELPWVDDFVVHAMQTVPHIQTWDIGQCTDEVGQCLYQALVEALQDMEVRRVVSLKNKSETASLTSAAHPGAWPVSKLLANAKLDPLTADQLSRALFKVWRYRSH